METGQDLRIVIYPPDRFDLGYRQCTGSLASEIYRLRAGAAILAFFDLQLDRSFPISPDPDDVTLPSTLYPSAEN